MEDMIAAANAKMPTFNFQRTITTEEMEEFLGQVILEDAGNTFARIASEFLLKRSEVEAGVREQLEHSPLMASISQVIMAERHVAATVGSVEDDAFGRVIQHSTQLITLSDLWLLNALVHAIEVHNLTPQHFVGWAARKQLSKIFHFWWRALQRGSSMIL